MIPVENKSEAKTLQKKAVLKKPKTPPAGGRLKYILIAVIAIGVALYLIYYPGRRPPEKIDYDALKKSAESTYAKGKYVKVVTKLEMYLKKNDGDTRARSIIASAYWQIGDFKNSAKHYRKLLKQKPGDPEIMYLLGLLSEKLDEPDKAVAYMKKAVEAKPESVTFQVQLAKLYHEQQRYDKAIVEWEILLLLPEDQIDKVEVYTALGEIYLAKEDIPKAKEAYEKGLALDPDNEDLKSRLVKISPQVHSP